MYNIVSWRQQFLHGLALFGKLLLIPVIVYGLYLGYLLWFQQNETLEVVSYGLEETVEGDNNPYGKLIFRGVANLIDESDEISFSIYEYDFESKENKEYMTYSEYLAFGSKDYDLALSHISETTDPDGIEPVWYKKESDTIGVIPHVNGYNETDLVSHPEKQMYAYSYQPETRGTTYLDTWNIAIHNFDTGEEVIITQAAEPKFSSTGEDVFYMTHRGIFRYNMATKESYAVTNRYNNFSIVDDFTVSPDDSTLIITSPLLHMISLNQLDESLTATEFGVIVTPDTRYRHPVISPDNRLYTVMAAKDSNKDDATGEYNTIDAELRTLTSSVLIDTISFEGMFPETVRPILWR